MITVYGMSFSGNCYKIKLLLTQLGIPFEWQEVDIMRGLSRTPEFLAKNPNGKVPVVELDPGVYLSESNAILAYLAEGTSFWSSERLARAQTLQWMFFEQYTHEPAIAVARFIQQMLPATHPRQTELPRLREKGYQALQVMEDRLQQHPFLVGDSYSIADIALFAYTHVAADGGFELDPYPALQTWIQRTKEQPGFIPLVPLTTAPETP